MALKGIINIWGVFFLLIIIIQATSCSPKNNGESISELFDNYPGQELISSVLYADGFDVYEIDNIKKLVIYNPQNITEILVTYYFADSINFHDFPHSYEFFETPLDSVAVFSATQLNAFSKLDILDKVIAISESEYIRKEKTIMLF